MSTYGDHRNDDRRIDIPLLPLVRRTDTADADTHDQLEDLLGVVRACERSNPLTAPVFRHSDAWWDLLMRNTPR